MQRLVEFARQRAAQGSAASTSYPGRDRAGYLLRSRTDGKRLPLLRPDQTIEAFGAWQDASTFGWTAQTVRSLLPTSEASWRGKFRA